MGEDDRGPVGLGTVSGHVESDDPSFDWDARESIEAAALDEALAWARARTPRVVLRLSGWDQEYSAGQEPIEHLRPVPAGLRLSRRRCAGWEFLDRADDADEIDWDVILAVDTFSLTTAGWPAFHAALGARYGAAAVELTDPAAALPIWTSPDSLRGTAHVDASIALLRVRGRTVAEADAVARELADAVAASVEWVSRTGQGSRFTNAGVYQTGSRAARRNAHLSSNGTHSG